MRIRNTIITAIAMIAAVAASACGDYGAGGSTAPNPPAPATLLKDVVIPNLPAPYYHFEYDPTGRVQAVSFASGLTMYDVVYANGRIDEMRNNVAVNHDRLQYVYDDAGRVAVVKYIRADGQVYTALFFSYAGQKLTGVERDRRVTGGFIIDKTMSFSYYPDGNLMELTERRPPIDGVQPATTTVDRFEQYDSGINVDGFGLIHDDFFDHLVLLPTVQLQQGNPARQIRTGDGDNFTVDYSYTYDAGNRPLVKSGDLVYVTGQYNGRRFQTRSEFSYY